MIQTNAQTTSMPIYDNLKVTCHNRKKNRFSLCKHLFKVLTVRKVDEPSTYTYNYVRRKAIM